MSLKRSTLSIYHLHFGPLLISLLLSPLASCDSGNDLDPPVTTLPPGIFGWTMQSSDISDPIEDIYFVNQGFGWAVGQETVLATSLGGDFWSPAPLDDSQVPNRINSIYFLSEQQGWFAVGNEDGTSGQIYISQQGGAYPSLQATLNNPMNTIFFLDDQKGWAAGVNGQVVTTKNGGQEWTTVDSLGVDLYGIQFTTETKGWAVGQNGSLYGTTDGDNFGRVALDTDADLTGVHFVDTLYGWVCGIRNTIYRRHLSEDNQVVWSNIRLEGQGNLLDWYDIFFLDRLRGWIVGEGGRIYRTNDGGITWEREFAPAFVKLNAIHMVSATKGWIAGDDGVILSYEPN
jgi:photosystem II stability/assembly factor-like uncharacterized protein